MESSRVQGVVLAAIGLLLANGVAAGAEGWRDQIQAAVHEKIAAGEIPGCVVCLVHDDRIVFHQAYGHRQLQPDRLPMQRDTVFDMASLTKPVATAMSVMKLVERGVFRLGDRYGRHVPEFKNHGKDDVRIVEMLTHQGGFVPDTPLKQYADRDQIWPLLCSQELSYRPGSKFVYSDVGYQFLGELVQRKSSQTLAEFAKKNIFRPLGMLETGFLPAKELRERAATTEQRDGHWMQGEVHDPRAYAMGGVAGHAGLFSTAADLSRYARMILREGELDGIRVLSPATVRTMMKPRDVAGNLRGLGWDINSRYSTNRGELMSERAIGHGGFTGTAMWIDPEYDLAVIFLSNRVHPNGDGSANRLASRIANIAVATFGHPNRARNAIHSPPAKLAAAPNGGASKNAASGGLVRTGADQIDEIDWLKILDWKDKATAPRIGVITNHTGVDRLGRRTIDRLHQTPQLRLTAIFSPEHGIQGVKDQANIADGVDESTGLPIFSLYGASRRPTADALRLVDAFVFDIQDIGARFYTYISTMKNCMQAAAASGKALVVLDRPNPLGGRTVAGPVLDAGLESFVGCHQIPVQHGMTVGELAQLIRDDLFSTNTKTILNLQIIESEGWTRGQAWDETGLPWIDPSPNMRSLTEAFLYPGIGLLETTNLSVGRGTDRPFEMIGAPWIDAVEFAGALNALQIPGLRFVPRTFTPSSSKFAGESCQGVDILVTDRTSLRAVEAGISIATVLRRLYHADWQAGKMDRLLRDAETLRRIVAGESPNSIAKSYEAELAAFVAKRNEFLIYADEVASRHTENPAP